MNRAEASHLNKKMGKDMNVLNQTNAMTLPPHGVEKKILLQSNLWHKIIIHDVAKFKRERVLRNILNAVHPLDLIPVNYTVDGENAHFLARNCGRAIEKLCRDNLIIQNPNGTPYILTVVLGFSNTSETQLNVQDNINCTINKCFNQKTKVLDLTNFHKNEDLSHLIFCVLSQPKILYFVLHLSKPLNPTSLILANNELKTLSSIEAMWGLRNLRVLDLRNNMIENMLNLRALKNLAISELVLDGNPVCKTFDEAGYIAAVKEILPNLEKLDGVSLGNKGFLPYRRNFLLNKECSEFVDQFLRHFFTLYDSKNRSYLTGLYHNDAMFSMTCSYIAGQNSSTVNLDAKKKFSRNLLKLSDFSKNCENLFVGCNKIVELFKKLPFTEHDPNTFACDTPLCSLPSQSVITVSGAFREPTNKLLDVESVYGFSRTFIITEMNGMGEYKIVNDMLHISNATSSLSNRSFKLVKVPANVTPTLKTPTNQQEKLEMIEVFSKITTLKSVKASGILEACKWDLKQALMKFRDQYLQNKVPTVFFDDKLQEELAVML